MAADAFGLATVTLSVVVPAFNEEERLVHMLREAVQYLQKRSASTTAFTWEVIVVDDGSRDRTFDVARRFAADGAAEAVRVIRLPVNCGKGAAVRQVPRSRAAARARATRRA